MINITEVNVLTGEVVEREYTQEDLERRRVLVEQMQAKIESGEIQI